MSASTGLMPITIVSDVICPWCFIGKARLERALTDAGLASRVGITWLPYELNPEMPEEGMDRTTYLNTKFGPGRRPEIEARLSEAALESGLRFAWNKVTRTPNTRAAHMLIAAASTVMRGTDMTQALFQAYFQEGRDIGDHDTLVEIATSLGFDETATREALANSETRETIIGLEAHAQRIGVTGVPFFILANRSAVSGAQPPDVWVQILTQIAREEAEKAPDERMW